MERLGQSALGVHQLALVRAGGRQIQLGMARLAQRQLGILHPGTELGQLGLGQKQ